MLSRRLLTTAALPAAFATPVLAQTTQPAKSAAPPTAASPAKPAVPAATTPMAKPINLNTATTAGLDALPLIASARAKAIVDARANAEFKNRDDFVARKVVPGERRVGHQEPGQILISNRACIPTDRRQS